MWPFRREDNGEEAKKALADARKNLRRVQRRGAQVTQASTSLKDLREENHFGEKLEEIFIEPWRSS